MKLTNLSGWGLSLNLLYYSRNKITVLWTRYSLFCGCLRLCLNLKLESQIQALYLQHINSESRVDGHHANRHTISPEPKPTSFKRPLEGTQSADPSRGLRSSRPVREFLKKTHKLLYRHGSLKVVTSLLCSGVEVGLQQWSYAITMTLTIHSTSSKTLIHTFDPVPGSGRCLV